MSVTVAVVAAMTGALDHAVTGGNNRSSSRQLQYIMNTVFTTATTMLMKHASTK
jgi:hypothetical protein